MNQELIDMAKSAGFELNMWQMSLGCEAFGTHEELKTFAALFAKVAVAAEREACAQLCDLAMLQNQETINELEDDEHIAKCFIQGAMTQLVKTSKAIRARGETK
jgi:flagellar motor component MotA